LLAHAESSISSFLEKFEQFALQHHSSMLRTKTSAPAQTIY
jgi:hypothetical protein